MEEFSKFYIFGNSYFIILKIIKYFGCLNNFEKIQEKFKNNNIE